MLCQLGLAEGCGSYNIRIRSGFQLLTERILLMRTALVVYFDDTVKYCFDQVLETMGSSVLEVIYARLERRGIPSSEISTRFDDVVQTLHESFGGSARVLVYKTVVGLFQQYSLRVDFTYQDSLKDHLTLLKERVVNDHLVPRRIQREDPSLEGRIPLLVQDSSPRPFRFK